MRARTALAAALASMLIVSAVGCPGGEPTAPTAPAGGGAATPADPAAPAPDPGAGPPIAERRGLETREILNDFEDLYVRASVAQILEAVKGEADVAEVRPDVARFEPMQRSWFLVQLKGHDWTWIRTERTGRFDGGIDELAVRLSKAVGAPAVTVGFEDTSAFTAYALYEKGELVEKFGSDGFEPFASAGAEFVAPEFESKRRELDWKTVTAEDEYAFVDAFLREQGIYVPFFWLQGGTLGWVHGEGFDLQHVAAMGQVVPK